MSAMMQSRSVGLWIVMVAIGVLLVSVSGFGAEAKKDGIFIHIRSGMENPHEVCMALNMAKLMSDDHDVLIYFDIKAVEVVLKDAKDLTYCHFPSLKEQLSTLPEKGVTLITCPGCLKCAGKTPDDLADGVRVADKEIFFSFTKGRIITLDY